MRIKSIKNRGGVFLLSVSLFFFQVFLIASNANAFEFISSDGNKKISVNTQLIITANTQKPSPSSLPQNAVVNRKISVNKSKKAPSQAVEPYRCKHKNTYNDLVKQFAARYGVNRDLITAIISVESCFNHRAVSPKGAKGLMQLMPATAKRFAVKNSFDPEQNIKGGVRYLQFLINRFKGDYKLAIAAYNAGEGAVEHYKGIPPYQETQQYTRRVVALLRGL